MRVLSPKEARQGLRKEGSLVNARVTGTLDPHTDRPTMFDRNVVFLDTIIEGDLLLSGGKFNRDLCLSGVTVNGLLSLDGSEIKGLLIVNTTVRGLISLRETVIKKHLDLRGLKATAIVIDYNLRIFGQNWERSANILHHAAPTIPIIYDFSSNIEED